MASMIGLLRRFVQKCPEVIKTEEESGERRSERPEEDATIHKRVEGRTEKWCDSLLSVG
jgi:hypothetical protein